MEISIIFVNWNSYSYLINCIDSIRKSTLNINYEIIVFDNDSIDRNIEYITNIYLDVRLINSYQNIGFAKANNAAAKEARGDILLFINPDVIVTNNIVYELNNIIANDKHIGIIGPKILNRDGTIQKDAARRLPTLLSMFGNLFMLRKIFPNISMFNEYVNNYNICQNVEFISGACLAIRKALFKELGGFSENYFMYSEDVDLCERVIKKGYKNYYLATYFVIHYGGGSSKETSNAKLFETWFFKSRRQYFENKSSFVYILINVIYIFGGLYRILVSIIILLYLYVVDRKPDKIKYEKLIIEKYKRVLLLGLGIDVIK